MASRTVDDLYGEVILDHNRNPRNSDKIKHPHTVGRAINPFCGDEIDLQMDIQGDRVARVGLQAVGCSINKASGSILTTVIAGTTFEEANALLAAFKKLLLGMSPTDEEIRKLGILGALSSVRDFPIRIKCALLPWTAFQDVAANLLADGN